MWEEYKAFILRGNVVDLAVAVVLAAAFGTVITAIVEGLVTPLIGAIIGTPDFSAWSFTINNSRFMLGTVINAIVSFLAVASVIFFLIVKPMNMLNERRARQKTVAPPAPSTEEALLTEIRDLLRQQAR